MRMIAPVPASRPPQFKSPHMIPQLHSSNQTFVGQLDQVSINRRPIKTPRPQNVSHLRMRQRMRGVYQLLHHPQPRRRTP